MVSGSWDKTVKVWSTVAPQVPMRLVGHDAEGAVDGVAFSPDGSQIVAAGGTSHGPAGIKVWNVSTGRLMRDLPGHKFGVRDAAFSPDGSRIAMAGLYSVNLYTDIPPIAPMMTEREYPD